VRSLSLGCLSEDAPAFQFGARERFRMDSNFDPNRTIEDMQFCLERRSFTCKPPLQALTDPFEIGNRDPSSRCRQSWELPAKA